MSKSQPFFAVRVTVQNNTTFCGEIETGELFRRDYVRGNMRMGRDKFLRYALGELLVLISESTDMVAWEIREIDADGNELGLLFGSGNVYPFDVPITQMGERA